MKLHQSYRFFLALALWLGCAQYSYAPNIFCQMWSIDASGNGADVFHTGDINRDGLIDVVSGWEQSGDLCMANSYFSHEIRALRFSVGIRQGQVGIYVVCMYSSPDRLISVS